MLKVSIINNRYDWSDPADKGIQFINPTFIYFKDYYEYYSSFKDKVEWVIPAWKDLTVKEYVSWVLDNELDVIGFGCYIWNTHTWIKVATLLKKANPHILIIAGGPDIDFINSEYAAKLEDSFNFVVKYDGEEPLRLILDKLVENKPVQDIDGVYTIKDSKMIGQLKNVINRRNTWYQENSPILNNQQILKNAFEEARQRHQNISITWGTTRGCPYKCAFCDWGVGEYVKVGKRNAELSKKELTFFAANRVKGIVLEDANWGIFNEDVDITKHWAYLYKSTGQIKRENGSYSKNRKENIVEIITIMAEAGMINSHSPALQDINEKVLKYNERPDLTWEEHQEIIKIVRQITESQGKRVKCHAQMILGMPGQTFTTIIDTYIKLGECYLLDDYYNQPFLVLPGAPVNFPALRKKYNIKHTKGFLLDNITIYNSRWEKDSNFSLIPVNYLTSCFSFTTREYLEIIIVAEFIREFDKYFYSVFDEGVDRREFYTNFKHFSRDILGDYLFKIVNYLEYHHGTDYFHLHIESDKFYLPLRFTSHLFLAIYKGAVMNYFKENYNIKVVSCYGKLCGSYGIPRIPFQNYSPAQAIIIMRSIYDEIYKY